MGRQKGREDDGETVGTDEVRYSLGRLLAWNRRAGRLRGIEKEEEREGEKESERERERER